MSSSELDGLSAFTELLDRYESAIRNDDAHLRVLDDERTLRRQAERERDSAKSSADHWETVARTRNDEIGKLQSQIAALRVHADIPADAHLVTFSVPTAPLPPAARVVNANGDDIPF